MNTYVQRMLKRNRLKTVQGQETIHQVAYNPNSGAVLAMDGILNAGDVIPTSTDISAAPVLVGTGSVLRITVSATTYIAFGDPDYNSWGESATSATTTPGLMLTAGTYLVAASGPFIRASANPTRIEILLNVLEVEGQ